MAVFGSRLSPDDPEVKSHMAVLLVMWPRLVWTCFSTSTITHTNLYQIISHSSHSLCLIEAAKPHFALPCLCHRVLIHRLTCFSHSPILHILSHFICLVPGAWNVFYSLFEVVSLFISLFGCAGSLLWRSNSWLHMQDLGPWAGIEHGFPALGASSLSHWITREVPHFFLKRPSSSLGSELENSTSFCSLLVFLPFTLCLNEVSSWEQGFGDPYVTQDCIPSKHCSDFTNSLMSSISQAPL